MLKCGVCKIRACIEKVSSTFCKATLSFHCTFEPDFLSVKEFSTCHQQSICHDHCLNAYGYYYCAYVLNDVYIMKPCYTSGP